jgi:hypothetical protein
MARDTEGDQLRWTLKVAAWITLAAVIGLVPLIMSGFAWLSLLIWILFFGGAVGMWARAVTLVMRRPKKPSRAGGGKPSRGGKPARGGGTQQPPRTSAGKSAKPRTRKQARPGQARAEEAVREAQRRKR